MQPTEWRPVVGYEGLYEVSDDGRVRSIERVVTRRNGHLQTVHARELRLVATSTGYRCVQMRMHGTGRNFQVHRLVATAFIGPGKPGQEVCHGDGTRTNNAVANLRWGTRSDNMQDSLRQGTHHNASKEFCIRGHEFTPKNTRIAAGVNGPMRVCIACRKRKVRCPLCDELRGYYGMKSHLLGVHKHEGGGQWLTGLSST